MRFFSLAIIALATVLNSQAATIFVDASAPAGGDGVAWTTAFNDLQAALNVAQIGSEIHLAHGVYLPSNRLISNNPRSVSFNFTRLIMRGGYAGRGAPNPDVRDFILYRTTLSGDLNGDDDTTKQPNDPARNNSENAFHVIYGAADVLDGFTISGGNANGSFPHTAGGGVFDGSASQQIYQDCTFEFNTSTDFGGAIYESGNMNILRCRFSANASLNGVGSGGAVFTQGGVTTVADCFFSGNQAFIGAGFYGIWAVGSSPQVIDNCVFSGNQAINSGGGLVVANTSPVVSNCSFSKNTASSGGAIYIFHGGSPTLTNLICWGDTGGEIAIDMTSFSVTSYCCIQGWAGGGTGNIANDPLFVDPLGPDGVAGTADDNLNLQEGSPCIDAGNNAAFPSNVFTDLAGNRRFDDDPNVADTGNGTAPIIDMGAYEKAFRPLAVADSATTLHRTTILIPALANDVSLNGGLLSITAVTQGTNGTVSINGSQVSYSANENFVGVDSFTYTISAGTGLPDTGTVTVTVTDIAPVANAQTISTHFNTAVPINLVSTDADGDALTYSHTNPANGVLTATTPNLMYTPNAGYVGPDSFTFKANDGALDSTVATVSINVTDTAPVSNAQTVNTHFNTAVPINLVSTDADGDAVTYSHTNPANGVLTGTAPNLMYTPNAGYVGPDSFTLKANDGALDSTVATITVNVTNTLPVANDQTISVHTEVAKAIALTATDADIEPLTYSIVTQPAHGTLTGTPPNVTYTSGAFAGSDSFTFKANDGLVDSNAATITIKVTDQLPQLSLTATPTILIEGHSVAFNSGATDPDGDPLTFSWNFGDGGSSTDANPTHVYATAGIYKPSVTVTDISGATVTQSIQANVFHDSDRPNARFVTSALNGFVGQPVGFDASFSTDPKNNIVSYDWDFGDGSPHGSQQIISRVYAATGTYAVTLTITDGDGLTDSTTLTMVVLPADQAGLANSNILYSVSWNRSATNADSLNLSAQVNVGTTPVTSTTMLSLGIVGQTFTGTSGTKLSLPLSKPTGPQVKWQVKPVTKKGTPKGTYTLKATVKHASLGKAFALAGVTGTKSASAKIPVSLGIGASNFASSISSQFRFGSGGSKASGGGSGPK